MGVKSSYPGVAMSLLVSLIPPSQVRATGIPVFIYKILASLIYPTVSMLFITRCLKVFLQKALKRRKLFPFSNLVTQIQL